MGYLLAALGTALGAALALNALQTFFFHLERAEVVRLRDENSRLMARIAYQNNLDLGFRPSPPLDTVSSHPSTPSGSYFSMKKPVPPSKESR